MLPVAMAPENASEAPGRRDSDSGGNGFLALWERRDRIDRSGKEEV